MAEEVQKLLGEVGGERHGPFAAALRRAFDTASSRSSNDDPAFLEAYVGPLEPDGLPLPAAGREEEAEEWG